MTHDVHSLILWIRGCLTVAAIGTTSVPIIYAFSPWYKYRLGQIFMLKAVSFAAAIDVTVLFQFWAPTDILIQFWVEAVLFSAIAVSTSTQAFMIWQLRRKNKKDRKLK